MIVLVSFSDLEVPWVVILASFCVLEAPWAPILDSLGALGRFWDGFADNFCVSCGTWGALWAQMGAIFVFFASILEQNRFRMCAKLLPCVIPCLCMVFVCKNHKF